MDGNGRWARKRFMPRVFGHKRGADSVRQVVRAASSAGVKVLTLFAFSEENWGRPDDEVNALMGLFDEYLVKELEDLQANNIRLRAMGDLTRLPDKTRKLLCAASDRLQSSSGMVLNLAVSYGSRGEIVGAARRLAMQVRDGSLAPEQISEKLFANALLTADLPDLDLVIRTSGEQRLSNFMLWQCSYAEFYFTKVLWPDFGSKELMAALDDFRSRQRRFGRVDETVELSADRSDKFAPNLSAEISSDAGALQC